MEGGSGRITVVAVLKLEGGGEADAEGSAADEAPLAPMAPLAFCDGGGA
jgi:hypothetical protein